MFGKLTFVPSSGGKAVEHSVSQRLTYVGRDKDCAIRVEDQSVDGKQFVISCADQQVKIQNLSRKLPTQVNQKSIGLREDQELRDKDTISFGNKQFVWTMSSSSGRRDPPRHDCLKRTRVSEPVRKVAVVTPNRRETLFEEDLIAMPPEKRRRTMFDPSAATPETSSFSRRVRYDKHMKQKIITPNRRKQSGVRAPGEPGPSSAKKKNISFAQPLESPQLTYNHETVFNKSITPGRFYRRNDGPFPFQGFKSVPEEPTSPGLLSGCDSFLSINDSQMSRRSSARVSTPYPNKSMRGSSQSNKTPQSRGPSGMYFPSIQEEMDRRQHGATPSSYFSSTSGSPRMMRAESPTVLPSGSGSPFQGRRSLLQSSRSSSYGTPQDQSLSSRNNSLYVNASGSSQMRMQDFESSSMNQSRYSWTNEGIPSPHSDSYAKTPPHMRTPRRSRVPIESPGSAAFSPNPSEANSSGYVLLSPRGKSIINRAFNRNDLSLQLSPQHSPSRRLFNFSARTPENRRHVDPAQSLSVQVLTKSLKKKLGTALGVGSPHNPVSTPSSSGRGGRTPKNSVVAPTTPEPVVNGTPKSTRSTASKRALAQSVEPDLSRASLKSGSITPGTSTPAGNSKRKGSVKADYDSPSKSGTPSRMLSRLSSDLTDMMTTPAVYKSEPKKSANKRESVSDEPAQKATPRRSSSSKRSLDPSPRQSSEPNLSRASRKSATVEPSTNSPVGKTNRSLVTGDEKGMPQPKTAKRSFGDTPRQSSEPNLSRLSRKSSDLRKSIPSTPVELPCTEPKRSKKETPNSEITKRASLRNGLEDNPSEKTSSQQSRRSKPSLGAAPLQMSEPDLSRSSRRSSDLRKSLLQSTPGDGKGAPQPKSAKRSFGDTPRQSSEPNLSRLSQKSSDLRKSIPSTPVELPSTEPKRSNKETPNSEITKRASLRNRLEDSPSEKALPQQPRRSKPSLGAAPRQMSEPDLSRSSRRSSDLRKSVLQSTPIGASKDEPKRSMKTTPKATPSQRSPKSDADVSGGATPRLSMSSKLTLANSPAPPSRSSRKSRDLNSSVSVSSPLTTASHVTPLPPKRSNTFTLGSPDKVQKQETSAKSSTSSRVSARVDLSPNEVTPPGTSVMVNLRSAHKLSAKKKDSPSSPLTAKKVAAQLLPKTRKLAKSLSADAMVIASPKSSVRNSLPVSLERSGRRDGSSLVQQTAQGRRSGSRSESPAKTVQQMAQTRRSGSRLESPDKADSGTLNLNRRSRASLVGEAAQLLHLSGTPSTTKKNPKMVIPDITVISPTPTKSASAAPASGGPALGRRSSRRSGTPTALSLHHGIRKTSIGKRPSIKSETPRASESVEPKSPEKSVPPSSMKSKRSSARQSSGGEPAGATFEIPSAPETPPRASSSSSESEAKVTPPRSVEPVVVMRSSRKTPRILATGNIPSTPTSALRRNARRSSKRSPIPSIKKLSLASPRKDSVKKLSLDPEKPDKNKMAALIACHKKKSPTKVNRPSSSNEKTSPGKSATENLTPLKDLDVQHEERSPEDALLDALDLSRKSSIVAEPKRPSRRLRSSTNRRVSAQASAQSSAKSTPASPSKSVKKLLFKTPLVEYEGSQQGSERSSSRSLKGILIPSPTTSREEPMSRVFTTSPVVDFTDASGRKKIFRASPNSKSKAGGIRELLPDEESDLNIWTLFEDSSSDSGSSGRKRRGSEPTDTEPPRKTNTAHNDDSASPPRSTRRKRAAEVDVAVVSSKRSREVARGSTEKASAVKSARKATTVELASSKSTRRNLREQFEHGVESPKPSTSHSSPKQSKSKVSPKVHPKQLREASQVIPASKSHKKGQTQSKAGGVKARLTPVKSPVRTRRAAVKSPKSAPKRPPMAGKAGTTKPPPKTSASKAKPKKSALPAKAKAQLKAAGSKVHKSSSPAKSPLKTRRGGVAKSPKKVAPAVSQSKSSKARKSSTPVASPAKTRHRAVVKTPKKAAVKSSKSSPKRPPVAGKAGVTKPQPKTSASKAKPKKAALPAKAEAQLKSNRRKAAASSPAKSPQKTRKVAVAKLPKKIVQVPPKAGKSAKSPPKASTSRAKPKSAPSPRKVSPKNTRGKVVTSKAKSPKPAKLPKPKAKQGAKTKTAQGPKARLSVPPKPLKAKAIGSKMGKKSVSPKNSPVKTRSRKPAAASTAKSSRGRR